MFDLETKVGTIKVGDENMLNVVKVGKRQGTLQPTEVSPVDLVLDKYKQMDGLWCNLFSLTQAMASGWKLGNEGRVIILTKGPLTIRFDRIVETGDSFICAVYITPREESCAATLAEGSTVWI